ncbi:hypothetical protein [Streptomyces sp. NPDC046859]|uniref:hypothetical protein n=1 Tax=Streptomyces sp. NPDC046859 TaxID=3155734 RepID=UPI0033DD7187
MLDTVPLQSRFLDHADHYARWSGLAIGFEFGPGDHRQRRDRAWAIVGAWGLLVSCQVLLVVLMLLVALTDGPCAGPLGAVTIVVICPLGLLSVFTFGWSVLTVVAPRAVDDGVADEGSGDDE